MTPGAAWLSAQRWFRAKHRRIASVTEVDRAPIEARADLRVLEVAYADGGEPDRYLAPTVGGREPRDGEGAWTALAGAIAADAELRGGRGTFVCEATSALDDLLPSARTAAPALGERRLAVEQSNTSVVLGERLILKLYRLLEPGENPDLEIGAFLTEAGFAETPAVAGSVHYRPDAGPVATAAMLQAFVPAAGDAWAALLTTIARDSRGAVEAAAEIGALTATMHAALASRPTDPGFPARLASVEETAAWRASAERQLADAVASLTGPDHDRLVSRAPAVRARFADSFGRAPRVARISRVHGDYHLGQLLARAERGYTVIDFEGEPARPLRERREPSSPLRDVAGMLRSFDYAARTVAVEQLAFDADGWLAAARGAFLAAYGGIGPHEAGLLDAFELEKACYEVRYEAANRPGWLWLPMAAIERLVA
jgi:maltokinase